jgi:hypothetical protein
MPEVNEAAVAVLTDGREELLALELCRSESGEAWTGFVDDLRARGLRAPLLAVIDGNPGRRGGREKPGRHPQRSRCTRITLWALKNSSPAPASRARE